MNQKVSKIFEAELSDAEIYYAVKSSMTEKANNFILDNFASPFLSPKMTFIAWDLPERKIFGFSLEDDVLAFNYERITKVVFSELIPGTELDQKGWLKIAFKVLLDGDSGWFDPVLSANYQFAAGEVFKTISEKIAAHFGAEFIHKRQRNSRPAGDPRDGTGNDPHDF
jgi:hypothetical protein